MNTLRITYKDGSIEEAPCRIGDDMDDCGALVVYWDGVDCSPYILTGVDMAVWDHSFRGLLNDIDCLLTDLKNVAGLEVISNK